MEQSSMFSLKIVTVDHYQTTPIPGVDILYSDFRGSEINNIPVIRIFGVTTTGEKACLHVHGVFPYISIPFDGGGNGNPEGFMQQVCLSIEKALNIASGRSNGHIQHIYKISIISGIPFYGYHEKHQKFLRIFFYNPNTVKKVVELLQTGAILNQVIQPYEAHIPYILQFFIDYNLYGMSTIDIGKMKFRVPLNTSSTFMKEFHENGNAKEGDLGNMLSIVTMDASVARQTYCEIECDCSSEDILNRKVDDIIEVNPGLKFIWEEERQRQKLQPQSIQLTPVPSQKGEVELTESEMFYKKRLQKIIERIIEVKDSVEETSNVDQTYREDGSIVNCTPAGVVELHKSLSQGKVYLSHSHSEPEISMQEQANDKPLTQSQNTSSSEDKEFLEMIISLIGNQTGSTSARIENEIEYHQSGKSVEIENYSDSDDELQMSLPIWEEDTFGMNSVQNTTTAFLEEKKYVSSFDKSDAKESILDDFIIPQVDGMHDTISPSNTTSESIKNPRGELPCHTALCNTYSIASEASWQQLTYTSSLCGQYNFHYGSYTSYNQTPYCQSNDYNAATNLTVSTSTSRTLNNDNNSEWLHTPSCSTADTTLQPNMNICSSSFTVLSNVVPTACAVVNEVTNSYRHLSKQSLLSSTNSAYSGPATSVEIKDDSLYNTIDTRHFPTIDTKILNEDRPKEEASYKSTNYLCSPTTFSHNASFDIFKRIELNNRGTQIYPCRVSGLIPMKTKPKSVCDISTQTNITNSKLLLHQKEKTEEQRKSNPRTLVVQNMKRLKLSLSKNRCNQKTGSPNNKPDAATGSDECNLYSSDSVPIPTSNRTSTNFKPYPFIHRPAPKIKQKKKTHPENIVMLSSSLTSSLAKGIVLPSYVRISDLYKIGKEKIVLDRLESSKITDKSKCNNISTGKPVLFPVPKLKVSEVKPWNKADKAEVKEKHISYDGQENFGGHKQTQVLFGQIGDKTAIQSMIEVGPQGASSISPQIAVKKWHKTAKLNQSDDKSQVRDKVGKHPNRNSKHCAISKLSRSYRCRKRHNKNMQMQSTESFFNTVNSKVDNKKASSRKYKQRVHQIDRINTIGIPPVSSVTKETMENLSSKNAGSDVAVLNKSSSVKLDSNLSADGTVKQITSNCRNHFASDNKKLVEEVSNNNVASDFVTDILDDETELTGIATKAKRMPDSLHQINKYADNTYTMPKLLTSVKKKDFTSLKTVPLKLTIKLPTLIRQPRVRKRRRKHSSNFKAFHPSPCWKSLTSPMGSSNNPTSNKVSRPKRPNVDYQAYAYTHLLEFDKLVELPCDETKKPCCDAKNINDPTKHCKGLEIRLERLKPEFLENMHLQQNDYKKLGLNLDSEEKPAELGKERIYQCLSVYPVSVETNECPKKQNNTPENFIDDDNLDVMWNLSYLSPSRNEHDLMSPPQCWSPNSHASNESSVESEKEIISEELEKSTCESLCSSVSSRENKHDSELNFFHSISNSPKSSSAAFTAVQERDCEYSSGCKLEINTDETLPTANMSDLEFNARNITFQQPKCTHSASLDLKSICRFADTDENSNITSNSIHSPPTVGLEEHDLSLQSKDNKVDCNKTSSEQTSDAVVEVDKITSEENIPPPSSSQGEDNNECLDFCKNSAIDSSSHENLNFDKTEISADEKSTEKSIMYLDAGETDIICNGDTSNCSTTATAPSESHIHEALYENQTKLCRNKNLNSPVEYCDTEKIVPRSDLIEQPSDTILATSAMLPTEANTDGSSKISALESFEERKKDYQHSEEMTATENLVCSDHNVIQQENVAKPLENSLLFCTESDDHDKHNSDSELGSKHQMKRNEMQSSPFKADDECCNVVTTESIDISLDQRYDDTFKNTFSPVIQGSCNSSSCVHSNNNNTTLLQSSNVNETNGFGGVLFSGIIECRKDEEPYSCNHSVEENQIEVNDNGVPNCFDHHNKINGSPSDVISSAEFIKMNVFNDTEKNEGATLVDENLLTSDHSNGVEIYGTDASCGISSTEINTSIENCDSPPSPEEKVIYDSQGNIMSSSTKCSQYSLCLGYHDIPQDDDVPFASSSECNMVKTNCLSTQSQAGITYNSVLNLMKPTQQKDSGNTEKSTKLSNEVTAEIEDECLKGDGCSHFSSTCLISNNAVKAEHNENNAFNNICFEQMSSPASSDSNLRVSTNVISTLSSNTTHITSDMSEMVVENRSVASVHEYSSDQSEIVTVTCKTCVESIVPSIKFHSDGCHGNIVLPSETKSLLHEDSRSSSTATVTELQNSENDVENSSNPLATNCIVETSATSESKCATEAHNYDTDRPEISTIEANSTEVHNDDDINEKNIEILNTTEFSKQALIDQNKNEKMSLAGKNSYCDNEQDFKKPAESLDNISLICADSSKTASELNENNSVSDITSTYLHMESSVPKTNNDNLNKTPTLEGDKNNISPDICSFYGATTFSSIECTTLCDNKSIQDSTSIHNNKISDVPFDTADEISSRILAGKVYTPQKKPPSCEEIIKTLYKYNIPHSRHKTAFYSCASDAPRINAELIEKLPTMKITELPKFEGICQSFGLEKWQSDITLKNFQLESEPNSSFSLMDAIKTDPQLKVALARNSSVVLQPVRFPPSRYEIERLLGNKDSIPKENRNEESRHSSLDSNDNPDIETTFSQAGKHAKLTIVNCKQKILSPVKELGYTCHQHSTPVGNQSKRRSNSWSGDKTDTYSQPFKRRRKSWDEESFHPNFDFKPNVLFIGISPIVARNNRVVEKKKRRLTLESKIPEYNECGLSTQTASKKMSSTGNLVPPTPPKHEFLTLMSLEIHAETRQSLRPDPKHDSIKAIFYCINNDLPDSSNTLKEVVGIIINDPESAIFQASLNSSQQNSFKIESNRNLLLRSGVNEDNIFIVEDEISLLNKLVDIVRKWNPDILCGYEIQMLSWGYLIQRAAYLNINLTALLSRVPEEKCSAETHLSVERDYYEYGSMPEMHITGRIVLSIWRIMRKEVTLNIYTFENVAYHVLHQRVPCYSYYSLTNWFGSQIDLHRWRVINFYLIRVKGQLRFLQSLDLISRTSTLARIFGIQFYEVLSRGSQFRVESMMLRSAKPLHYVAISPSPQKRAKAKAPECFALVMEPESTLYTDPVVVLDFQSLYPSMIIAYNYCYSTCLGRVACLGQDTAFEFGCASLTIPSALIKKLENDINISPNGVAFVKHHIRMGVLPQMLHDILSTRIMVKNAMKACKDDKDLHRLLDGRQLALKLISNVTYGYTAANFSGRMPCVEIADSIVSKARETLERAIKLVERTAQWNAKVVYGDTDSLFVLLKGRSKEQAFKIGQEIAETVTAINPKPVKLKFEKVYLPCILQTKKRYVGFMYETPEQLEPVFDAKGIETIRRDSCPIVAQILETSLRLLFTKKDLSLIKRYVQKQFQNILSGKTSLQDFIFAREYRGMSRYRPNACVPGLEITRRLINADPRAEPRVGERVPYVVVYGFPGLPLIQLIRQPQELLADPSLRINAKYYIRNVVIPPLHRVFSLIGANVASWYINMPWCNDTVSRSAPQERNRCTLSQYLTVRNCVLCNKVNDQGLCDSCKQNPQHAALTLTNKIRKWERKFHNLSQICQICTGAKYRESGCVSLDCPILFELHQANRKMSETSYYRQLQQSLDF